MRKSAWIAALAIVFSSLAACGGGSSPPPPPGSPPPPPPPPPSSWNDPVEIGSSADDYATTGGMYFDTDGSIVLGGRTDGQIGTTASAGGTDSWLARLDSRGIVLWTTQFGDAEDNNARTIIPHPQGLGTYVVESSNPTPAARVLLIDNFGAISWSTAVDFGGENVFAAAYGSFLDSAGDLYIASWRQTDITVQPSSLLTKVSGADGALIWNKPLNHTEDDPANDFIPDSSRIQLRAIDEDSNGNLIIAGNYSDRGAAVPRNCGAWCSFLASVDADGNDLWVTEVNDFAPTWGDFSNAGIYRIKVDADDTIVVAGHEQGFTNTNGAVARYSQDGSQNQWTYCDDTGDFWSTAFTQPLITSNGDIYVYMTVQAEEDPVTLERESANIVVSRLDSDGLEFTRFELSVDDDAGDFATQFAGSIAEGPDGYFYLSGSLDLPLRTPTNDQFDVFVIRIDEDGNLVF